MAWLGSAWLVLALVWFRLAGLVWCASGWIGLGWAGLGRVKLGRVVWVATGWSWVGLDLAVFDLAGLAWVGLGRIGIGLSRADLPIEFCRCLFAIDVIDFRYMGSIPKPRRVNFVVSWVLFACECTDDLDWNFVNVSSLRRGVRGVAWPRRKLRTEVVVVITERGEQKWTC